MAPDLEATLIPWAMTAFDVSACTDLPANLADVLPMLQIAVLGGAGDRFSVTPRVDVDAYAVTYEAARDLSATVHDALMALRGRVGDVIITDVRADSLPARRPYDNPALRRVGASYTIAAHPKSYA